MRDFHKRDYFKLGTFATNCSGGMTVSKVADRWESSWENNLKLAKLLDDAHIDFMLPIARWIGYGGETNFHYSVLETITWATALLASTKQLNVFATVHTAANSPVVVAKQLATIDHVSNGRVGLNIVAGWNKPEYGALGLDLPSDHETRYGYAQEWFDVVQKHWQSTEAFDWSGKYFKLKNALSHPQPIGGRPAILNAAGSEQGRKFAVKNADFLFTPAIDLDRSVEEVAALKEQAAAAKRKVGVFTFAHICCRPTEQAAKDELKRYAQTNADWEAVDNLIELQFENAQSFPHDLLALIRDRMAAGHGGFPLTGTPEQVADGIESLAKVGFAGTTISFLDYAKEFPYFRDNVLPILVKKGLRPY